MEIKDIFGDYKYEDCFSDETINVLCRDNSLCLTKSYGDKIGKLQALSCMYDPKATTEERAVKKVANLLNLLVEKDIVLGGLATSGHLVTVDIMQDDEERKCVASYFMVDVDKMEEYDKLHEGYGGLRGSGKEGLPKELDKEGEDE